MTPAGPERNKRIAELRGEEIVCIHRSPTHRTGCVYNDICERCFRFESDKPYSTDISAAMELWDEMKEWGKQSPDLLRLEFIPVIDACLCYIGQIGCEGKDEADAISGCYLKWKESV